MSKLKQAIEEKDWIKAKRLILDNPEYLEENVDLLLGMVREVRIEKDWLMSKKKMIKRMNPPKFEQQYLGSWETNHSRDKELSHEQAIRINEFKDDMKKAYLEDKKGIKRLGGYVERYGVLRDDYTIFDLGSVSFDMADNSPPKYELSEKPSWLDEET